MQRRKDVLYAQQSELFQPAKAPRWVELPPDVRARATKLVTQLLLEQGERVRIDEESGRE
jgi:hypothetical protein